MSNPGASGSVFYKTSNDKFILKTVQHQEAEFLKTLLSAYTLVCSLGRLSARPYNRNINIFFLIDRICYKIL